MTIPKLIDRLRVMSGRTPPGIKAASPSSFLVLIATGGLSTLPYPDGLGRVQDAGKTGPI